MKKLTDFTHSEQKNIHINGCKIVHKCTIATVPVHICTAIVACAFNILRTKFSYKIGCNLRLQTYLIKEILLYILKI